MTRTSKPTRSESEKPPRLLLRDVELTPRRRMITRVHAMLLLVFAVIAAVTELLPAHEVYESDAWDGLGCAFLTDCDPSLFDSSDDPASRRVAEVHSNYHHDGIAPLLLLAVFVALAIANLVRLRWHIALASSVSSLVWLVALFFAIFNLDHMFDNTRLLPAGEAHASALAGLFLTVLAWIPLVLILYLGARRARRREADANEPDLPTATARPGSR